MLLLLTQLFPSLVIAKEVVEVQTELKSRGLHLRMNNMQNNSEISLP